MGETFRLVEPKFLPPLDARSRPAACQRNLATGMVFALELTPLIKEANSPQSYVQEFIDRFAQEVMGRLARLQ
jgi:hypothetical protein